MEKKKPTYHLKDVKELIEGDKWAPTGTAKEGAHRIGLDTDDIRKIVLSLNPADFYKSMTSIYDHTIWQDVYHKNVSYNEMNFTIYIKLQILENVVVIQFKEK